MDPIAKVATTALFAAAGAAQSYPATGSEDRIFDTDRVKIRAAVLVDGLVHPWGLDFLPDGSALVTERQGRLRIFDGETLSAPVEGVPRVVAKGQGGLLDVVAAPDFATSGKIYLSYAQPGRGGAGTAVAGATLVRDGERASLTDVNVIFSMEKKTSSSVHFGSRLVFAPDGTLFVTVGERGDGNRAQDANDAAGSVIRINPDGSAPADNPSPDGKDRLAVIWSTGHRNPQGAVFDPVWKGLVTVEHGARGGDEINKPEAGKNYGWPIISYGVKYSGGKIGRGTSAEGYEQPLYYWDPSIAPSGLASYQGAMFPEWQGDLLVGALKFQLLSRLDRDDNGKIVGEERMFEGAFGRIRNVDVAPDGSVWLLTDQNDGAIIRLSRVQ